MNLAILRDARDGKMFKSEGLEADARYSESKCTL